MTVSLLNKTSDMSQVEEISQCILPKLASSGHIGSAVRFLRCEFDSAAGEAQFASSVYFLVAVFQSDEGILQLPLVVKYNMGDELVRKWLNLDCQFQNEVITYEKILPFLDSFGKTNEIFPKFFFGSTESVDPGRYVIVLEDLRSSGYKLTREVLDLDFAHCALAFRKLGSFHALSFAAKKLNSERFFEVMNNFVETRLFDCHFEDDDYLFAGSVARAAEPLLRKGIKVNEIENFLKKIKNSTEYFKNLLKVKEPMGVICHGDFCRNNVLYKYDNEKPVDIKLFDLAHARYGSPMLDFTFFFLLNCSEESRKTHREEYLQIYHDSLSATVPDVEVPSLEDFKEEFRLKAVYGYLHCAFFKPAMMDPVPFNPMEAVREPLEVRAARTLNNAGEKGTAVIATMLNELIDLKCVL